MKNFIQRAITGALYVAVIVGCILFNPLSFGVLFAIISALTIHEFGTLVNKLPDVKIHRLLTPLGGSYLFFAIMGYCLNMYDSKIFIPYLIIILYILIRELYLKHANPINNWAYSLMTQLYIALPFALLNVLAFHTSTGAESIEYNPVLPLAVFLFIWIGDTGAYCVGITCGKHRLFERISPKKSWEGSIGGGVFAIMAAVTMAHYFPIMSIQAWIGFALVIVVFGTWGDLIESLFKRQLGIKDSGSILPGHGGWLDRLDSALLAIPAAVVYLYLIY